MGKQTERTGLIRLHKLGWKLCDYSGYLRAEDDPEDEYYVLTFNRSSNKVTLWLSNKYGTSAAKHTGFTFTGNGVYIDDIDAFRYFLNRLDGFTPKAAYEAVEKANEELSDCPEW